MAHKKSIFILVTAFIFMALVSTGCERSYAPIDAQATPTIEGGAFPEALPSDMEGVFEAGAQTATAQAIEAGAPAVEEPTLAPEAAGEGTELAPEAETPATEVPPEEVTPEVATEEAPTAEQPTEAPAPSTNEGNLPATYTLRKGEFPYCIARRYNVNPSELLSLNGISTAQANVYQPGLTLSLPQSGNPFPSDRARNNHPVTYIVPETTTVYGVACYFGDVRPAAILNANPSINADQIAAGTSLQIP